MDGGKGERACKRVIGARLRQASMRWSKSVAQDVLNLRAQLICGRWDTLRPLTRPRLAPA